MEFICFNDMPLSPKQGEYGGMAGLKLGIVYQGVNWMLKFPKNTKNLERVDASYSTTPLSEYLGSHVYQILGYPVHETVLGERDDKVVVACKDFEDDFHKLKEIRQLKNAYNKTLSDILDQSAGSTGSDHLVDLKELMIHMEYNSSFRQINGIEERFWEQAVIDVFINNNDRNNGNWGIIRDGRGIDRDILAPIYDNGGSFQNKLSEEKIKGLLADKKKTATNASNTQTIYGIDGHAISSVKFLGMWQDYDGLKNAIKKVVPLIGEKMPEIEAMFADTPETCRLTNGQTAIICSKERKELFLLQLHARYENLLYRVLQEIEGSETEK